MLKPRIGKFLLLALAAGPTAWGAGSVEFSATVDRPQVTLDDSVSLKLSIRLDGNETISAPTFSAPDFETINQYQSTYVESYYENGHFGMRNTAQITEVLKPTRAGTLTISDIQVKVGAQNYRAANVSVQVGQSGAGTPPPKNYGGSGIGLRGAGKQGNAAAILVRAELDKDHAYKGEQVIVSYYLYRRVRVFNIQVEKFPVLGGFLREDLEIPIMSQRLDGERVVLDGVPYERALLARYAAYPLQEGKLKIDSMGLKYNYFNAHGAGADNEDPFMNFFQQLTPLVGNQNSQLLTLDVAPLPTDGRPASFSGGVGDFNVTSAVDKYEVHANEAVNLAVKIEGRGNLAAVGEPKAKWPDNVELYDSKGRAKPGKGGVGEKVFEFVLIPRTPGKVQLPALEFTFFDPAKKQFVTKTTEPITLTVSDPLPGSAAPAPRASAPVGSGTGSAEAPALEAQLRPFKGAEESTAAAGGLPAWRYLYWAAVLGGIGFFGLVISDLLRRGKKRAQARWRERSRAYDKSFARLRESAKSAQGAPFQEIVRDYERLSGLVFDALDRKYELGARSFSRNELERLLVGDRELGAETWKRLSRLLEFAEAVRFAISVGAVSESKARSELAHWVNEAELLVGELAG